MRRIFKPIVIGLSLLLVVVLVAVAGLSLYVGRRPLPSTQGERTVEGLIDEVTIVRNAQGVPDIYANNDLDLFFAQGYVQAQDRFFEMDYRRHVTAGRLSELVGNVPAAIRADVVVRTLGWRLVAEEEWDLLEEESREYLQAFTDGVNAYIEPREASELALEYTVLGINVTLNEIDPWTPVDSLAWLKAMAWDLRANYDEELERTEVLRSTGDLHRVNELFPNYSFSTNLPIITSVDAPVPVSGEEPSEGSEGDASSLMTDIELSSSALASAKEALDEIPSLLGVGDAVGSNSFVISGQFTETGKPILANDPHLDSSAPGIWYQTGLHCRELSETCTFDVSGFTFAGLPGVIIGQNLDLAWGLTNMGADVTDFFLERVQADGTYKHGDDSRRASTRTETILVADADPIDLTIMATGHGPIVSGVLEEVGAAAGRPKPPGSPPAGVDGYQVSLAWTALMPGRTMDAIFSINRAADAVDIAAAAALFDSPAQNIVFATASGDIGYQAPGRIPIRAESLTGEVPGIDSSWPRLGWDPQFDWQGFVPAENLPHTLNPAEGFIVAANQPVTGRGESVYLTNDWDYGFRSQRLRELIEEKISAGELITVEDANAFMMDASNPIADELIRAIDSLKITDRYLTAAIDELKAWRDTGYSNDVDSAGAAYFNAVWAHLLRLTFADELDRSAWPYGGSRTIQVVLNLLDDPENDWWDYVPTVHVTETRDEILLQALTHARDELTNRISSDVTRWRWGYLHQARLQHPILSDDVLPGPLARIANPAPFEVGGSTASPLATAWDASLGDDGRIDYSMTTSPSMRMVVDIGERNTSTWVTATGVSGHPTSRHYRDQISAWAAGEYYEWNMTTEAVEAATERTLILTPFQ